MDASKYYSDKFYKEYKDRSLLTAQFVAPFLLALFPNIRSVVDIGCGAGAWLKVFSDLGIAIDGYDFGAGVTANLMIPVENFHLADLTSPLNFSVNYDLTICLEVAEHIDESSADVFLENIAKAGDILLFSAAIPRQPGVNHFNCQWPAYWVDKFMKYGFNVYDILRPIFWETSAIPYWYRQNMMLFVRNISHDTKANLDKFTSFRNLPLIHPTMIP